MGVEVKREREAREREVTYYRLIILSIQGYLNFPGIPPEKGEVMC